MLQLRGKDTRQLLSIETAKKLLVELQDVLNTVENREFEDKVRQAAYK